MAAGAIEETETVDELSRYANELKLEELVQNATWRDILGRLIDDHRIDPWDIDISRLVEEYIKVIKRMRVLDLRVPANIILAASIMLRFKSEAFSVFDIIDEAQQMEESAGHVERIRPSVDPLTPRARLQPRRRITLDELMHALDEAIKIEKRREEVYQRELPPLNITIDEKGIDEKIESAMDHIRSNLDTEGLTTFAHISSRHYSPDNVMLDLFVPLLFLNHKRRISIWQEEFFGEIFIKVMEHG
ncbi:MAG: segregation/condensation protein A [Candidatus Micrarchaeota archaeon]|nr:segregation/condensation protein A [Candidatus Micrarchaeota archaeon]